jgi:hypothetical protein
VYPSAAKIVIVCSTVNDSARSNVLRCGLCENGGGSRLSRGVRCGELLAIGFRRRADLVIDAGS